ncbi:quinon protein alcohol dehydrogenase-like superfamily [Apiospora phragmitis]|uniref:Quinon protein alcohol dehydrogenase-like superfamily n=1 Tax=Apiospora phragmitis TaxID=2905665 RepID=A0ABR1VTN4_9PEZI
MSVILCTAGYDHTIRFWEALSGICSRTIQHPDSQVNRLCISPDKRFLAAAGHHTVKLYDIKSTNPNPLLTFEGHTNNITGVAGTVQRTYSHGSPVNDVVIHPNQGEIISCDRRGSVRIWDLAENNCSHELIPEEDVSVSSVTVASDGTLLCAANNNGNVYVWALIQDFHHTQLLPVTHFSAHKEYITRILLSPDVKKLATCSADHTAKIWVVADVDPSIEVPVINPQTSTPRVLPSDTINNTISPNPIRFPDADGNPPKDPNAPKPWPLEATLTGHQRWVWDCAFSADSAYLVTACSDHYARLWELHSQQVIRQYNGHHRGAVDVREKSIRQLGGSASSSSSKQTKTKKKTAGGPSNNQNGWRGRCRRPSRGGHPRRRPPSPYISNADAGIPNGATNGVSGGTAADGTPDSVPDGTTSGENGGVTDDDANAYGNNWTDDVPPNSLENEAIEETDDDEAVGSGSDWEDAPLYQQLQLRNRLRERYRNQQ